MSFQTASKNQDLIYEKTVNPIQTGGMVVGYLHFRTTFQRDEVRAPDTLIKVFFFDVMGKQCEANFDYNTSISLPVPRYTPGVQTTREIVKTPRKNASKKH